MKVLITGSQGFIGSYICSELLAHDYRVIGVDNFSKYGRVERGHDTHPNFTLLEQDVQHMDSFPPVDYIIAGAAMIGGIAYFHKYAYDLLATNERIMASTFDAAIQLFQEGHLKRIIVMSSSMVFENTTVYPTPESDLEYCRTPSSTYGFQKLACEYFCHGALQQYGLPFSIVRPFNCVGVGEEPSRATNEMILSHVLPDLIRKAIQVGPDNLLPILGDGSQLRHYTNGKDIGRAVRIILESEKAVNDDFNISCSKGHTVREVAHIVWEQLFGHTRVSFLHSMPFEHDVKIRSPDVSKAKERLGISCDIPLEVSVKEVIEWIRNRSQQ